MDVFGGEIRRRDVFPLLVLHLISREPAYGNRLIEEIEAITDGVISVNPNTIYPLLRDLEGRGLIDGQWEHPDRRTRRFYSITSAGRKEYRRLVAELEPFLDSVIESVTLIKREIYGAPLAGAGDGEQGLESVVVDASLAEVWDYYFDPRRMACVGRRVRARPRRPTAIRRQAARCAGARSRRGAGRSTEHVLEHEPRRLHRVAFSDPESVGELRTRFEMAGQGTAVTQELEYRLRRRGPFVWLTDRLFIRSQVRGSIARTLARLRLEVEELPGR